MEDREFFDLLYSQWAKTTGAEDKFWMPEEDENNDDTWIIHAVAQDQSKTRVGIFHSEADADFISGVHGCVADLIRRLHSAVDEAERMDRERDDAMAQVFELATENETLKKDLEKMNQDLLHAQGWVATLREDVEFYQNQEHRGTR